MTLHSTHNQLIQYAYGELPLLERLEAEFALETSTELSEEYKELRSAINALPKVTFSPAPTTIANILSYSRQSTPEA